MYRLDTNINCRIISATVLISPLPRFNRTFAAIVLLASSAFARPAFSTPPTSPAVRIEAAGVPNFFKVDDGLYRSAQPTAEGMRNLEKLGIKTVVNLRGLHSDDSLLKDTALTGNRIKFNTWHAEEEDLEQFLRIVTDPAKRPVLVHCLHGADRTGSMVAIYRVVVQGWSKEDALAEMTGPLFGFHSVWQNLIRWVNGLDYERLKADFGGAS